MPNVMQKNEVIVLGDSVSRNRWFRSHHGFATRPIGTALCVAEQGRSTKCAYSFSKRGHTEVFTKNTYVSRFGL